MRIKTPQQLRKAAQDLREAANAAGDSIVRGAMQAIAGDLDAEADRSERDDTPTTSIARNILTLMASGFEGAHPVFLPS